MFEKDGFVYGGAMNLFSFKLYLNNKWTLKWQAHTHKTSWVGMEHLGAPLITP